MVNFPVFHTFWEIIDEDWIFRIIWWLNNWFAILSYTFLLSIIVIFGVELSGLFQKLKHIFLTRSQFCKALDTQGSPEYRDIVTNLEILIDCYDIYLEIAGTYALISVPSAVIALGQFLHQFVTGGEFQLMSHCIACVLWLYNIANVGEYMQAELQGGKDDIRNALFMDQRVPLCENCRELANWILGWKWRFTAWNIFVVQRSLILGCLETVMTYVIFLFQLKSSEGKN
ncbi:unnamed protein product [Allacma fusca]|uniref:Uncharacterized protein n=1 Tax=Allacma fusca TaxID=39272 RepID=A0A8J2P8H3_9HEXA|nr:unnamed protein product [Allacma fusca]